MRSVSPGILDGQCQVSLMCTSLTQCKDHAAQGSICTRLRDGFAEFLLAANSQSSDVPESIQQLEKDAGIRIVIADRQDPEDVGFVQWRAAFYVAGSLPNALMLLDDFFQFKAKSRERPLEETWLAIRLSDAGDFCMFHLQEPEPSRSTSILTHPARMFRRLFSP